MLRYLTSKVDGSTAPPPNDKMSTYKTPDPKPKTVRMWACDVCKKTFPDFDQACRHEEECRAAHQEQDNDDAKPVVHDVDGDTPGTFNNPKVPSSSQVTSSQGWSCDVCQKPFADYEEACRHEDKCRQKAERKAVTEPSKPVHPFFAKETKEKSKKRSKKSAKQEVMDIDDEDEQETSGKTRKRKATQKDKKAVFG